MIKRTLRNRNQLTIPAEILKALGGLGKGDDVEFRIEGNRVTLVPLMAVPRDSHAEVCGQGAPPCAW